MSSSLILKIHSFCVRSIDLSLPNGLAYLSVGVVFFLVEHLKSVVNILKPLSHRKLPGGGDLAAGRWSILIRDYAGSMEESIGRIQEKAK